MGGVDQGLEVGIGAEVRIDVGEIGDPIAVIAGGLLARRPCTGLFLKIGPTQIACAQPWI
jgi:hypothetical protein